MKCLKCGTDNSDEQNYCGECGTNLALPRSAQEPTIGTRQQATLDCHACGKTMPAGAVFCGVCGKSLRVDAPSLLSESNTEGSRVNGTDDPALNSTIVRDQKVEPEDDSEEVREVDLRSPEGALREMVLVPAGWYAMGAFPTEGNPDEHPQHQVQLSAYYIDRCAVSNLDFEKFAPDHRRNRIAEAADDLSPVVFVSRQECLEYCRWRSEQEGVSPDTYSLPTEAQWERAARGGFPNRLYPWGSHIVPEACNTREVMRLKTVAVDEGTPNGFSLFHMGSNVREWCSDFYSPDYYSTREATGPNPCGPERSVMINMHVVRGASFQDLAAELGRCAARNYGHPSNSSSDVGFRCVRLTP